MKAQLERGLQVGGVELITLVVGRIGQKTEGVAKYACIVVADHLLVHVYGRGADTDTCCKAEVGLLYREVVADVGIEAVAESFGLYGIGLFEPVVVDEVYHEEVAGGFDNGAGSGVGVHFLRCILCQQHRRRYQ